jgi:alkanesulfonate monooxygenase SsuD/methylene tetrahydromethanopterin reductase-like flavin-dependent oxidoreductase (luciferase family)
MMRLGTILLWGDDLAGFQRRLRLAEELGYGVIGVGDSPAAWHDMYVSLAVAAQETRSATLATMVTTPFLRHPSVTASGMSALHELTGGRVVLAIGSGGSALRTVGRTAAAPQAEMRAYVTAVRDLLGGGTPVVDGRTTSRLARARSLPVYVSADGPKGLALAGEIADGVVIGVGLSIETVERKIAAVRAAAERAGRNPDAIDVWGMSFASVRDDRAEADADITAFLASTAGMGLKAPHMREIIPPGLLGAVEEIERRYDPAEHVVVGGKNARLLEELGLVDFMVGLKGLTGDGVEVAGHLRRLEAAGVSCVLAALPGHADPDGTLRRLSEAGEGLMPATVHAPPFSG